MRYLIAFLLLATLFVGCSPGGDSVSQTGEVYGEYDKGE